MRQIILGIAVVIMAFTLKKPYMIIIQGIAGIVLILIGVFKASERCPSCGLRMGHDEHCQKRMCP